MDDRLKKVFLVIIVSVPIVILGWFGVSIYLIDKAFDNLN